MILVVYMRELMLFLAFKLPVPESNSCPVMYLSYHLSLSLFLSLEEVEINNLMFQTWNDASSVVGSNILTCPTLTNGTQYITGH